MKSQHELDSLRKKIETINWDLRHLRIGDRRNQLAKELDLLKKEYAKEKALQKTERDTKESPKQEDE